MAFDCGQGRKGGVFTSVAANACECCSGHLHRYRCSSPACRRDMRARLPACPPALALVHAKRALAVAGRRNSPRPPQNDPGTARPADWIKAALRAVEGRSSPLQTQVNVAFRNDRYGAGAKPGQTCIE